VLAARTGQPKYPLSRRHRELRPRLSLTQMPLGFHKHSNRSRQALNETAVGTSAGTPSSGSVSGDEARSEAAREARTNQSQLQPQAQAQAQAQPQQQSFAQLTRTEPQPYTAQTIAPDHDPRHLQQKPGEAPGRSQSIRYSGAYQQPPSPSQHGGSADDLIVDSRRYQQPPVAQNLQPPTPEPAKKRTLFDRMRSSNRNSSEPKPPPSSASSNSSQGPYNNTTGLGRRLSKKEQASAIRTQQQNLATDQPRPDWHAAQDSRSHLPSPLEANEDDTGSDPYLVRDNEQGSHQRTVLEANYPQTIRTVQSDSTPLDYPSNEAQQQQFEAQQQHLREQLQQQQVDIGSHNYYQSHLQQPQVNISPASAISTLSTTDPYRQQNPETVSQLSYDSPIDQREEPRPGSVQSNNGQSPTVANTIPHRGEHPNRSTSIPQGPRPQSLYGMAPLPTGAGNRRSADPKQTMQAAQGQTQGQGQSQGQGPSDGPPPNYSRGQFPNSQSPATGLPPIPPPAGNATGNYRGGPPQREHSAVGGGEQGRSTPPPATAGGSDIHELYKEICESRVGARLSRVLMSLQQQSTRK
jgi:hypothetical protein